MLCDNLVVTSAKRKEHRASLQSKPYIFLLRLKNYIDEQLI